MGTSREADSAPSFDKCFAKDACMCVCVCCVNFVRRDEDFLFLSAVIGFGWERFGSCSESVRHPMTMRMSVYWCSRAAADVRSRDWS